MLIRSSARCFYSSIWERCLRSGNRGSAHAEAAARAATILSETDLLTGIANRRRAPPVLDQAILTSRQSGRPVSIAIFDIDRLSTSMILTATKQVKGC